MGNDGGTLATARRLVVKKKRAERPKDAGGDAPAGEVWRTCALSGTALRPPLALCKLGFIYSKEAILEALLARTVPADFGHVRKASDLCTLAPTFRGVVPVVVCPVTGQEGGAMKAFWSCGHVVARSVADTTCPVCGVASEAVAIDPTASERALRRAMLDLGPTAGTKRDRDTPADEDAKRARPSTTAASAASGASGASGGGGAVAAAAAAPVSRWGAAVGAKASASKVLPTTSTTPAAPPTPSIGFTSAVVAIAKQKTEEDLKASTTLAHLVHRS
jgi:Rtf2 RING-finger